VPSGPEQGATSPLLIANRGEIAVRIARTAHRLGLKTVGVFTDADQDSLHVDTPDQAVRIGSYLDMDELIGAATRTGANAVHPGYGFLSENAAFAQAVIDAGLTWVGPPPSAIELMGDKGRAKEAARQAGVPIVPAGDDGHFPVVVKALAGGGGKGMRVVHEAADLEEATAAAMREARAAFGDDRVMIERWIERPRHIEMQVLADRHGTVIHLGERECSLQRRHQKVVEEAPSPILTEDIRTKMGAAAVALAKACGYENAGTVEFITPADATEFFFLEMNTRLQVEHPVTELVHGLDLVELQLRVAAGEPLLLGQGQVRARGHAIEARVYAEDPASGFLPATGTIRHYREPRDARVDSGIRAGTTVGTAYDPLLAKVIAHGRDRTEALDRLDRALAELELLGLTTNAPAVRALIARDDVRAGEQDTGLIERVLPELELRPPPDLLLAGALAAAGTAAPPGRWWRRFEHYGEVSIAAHTVTHDDHTTPVRIRAVDPYHYAVELEGIVRHYAIAHDRETIWVARDGHHLEARTRAADRSHHHAGPDSLEAPMPGTVLQVRVKEGDEVDEGDVLLVLESMKMELSIVAPHPGTVAGLALNPGDRVERGQALVAVATEDPGE
jgi:acetyl-CoA/propionyl-CoA carboxylase, biotin carboxylase, biotin carboxyl carrier protein